MTEEKSKKHYDVAADVLRILAILAVVLIHTSSQIISSSHFSVSNLSTIVFVNQAIRFAVPLFFMLSGFVLEMNYANHTSYLTFFKKRFLRILIPYIFWSILYLSFFFPKSYPDYVQLLLTGGAAYQLYFIPTLLIFYLFFPLLHYVQSFIFNKIILVSSGIVQLCLLYYNFYMHEIHLFQPLHIALLNYFVFLAGMYAEKHKDKLLTRFRYLDVFLFFGTLTLVIFIFIEGNINYANAQDYSRLFFQWRPSVLLYTVFLSWFLYRFISKKCRETKIIHSLARLSFFVFFIHLMTMQLLWESIFQALVHRNQNIFLEQYVFNPVLFLSVTLISFSIAYIVHKIPFLPKVTG